MCAYIGDCDGIWSQDVIVYRKARWGRINIGERARTIWRRNVEVEGGQCRAGRDG